MEKQYSVGEVSKITGLSIRTLQHYDNIGLLTANRSSDNNRRYYTQHSFQKLEYIVFYKALGISLKEIQELLKQDKVDLEIQELLNYQKTLLINQTSCIDSSIAAIEASEDILSAGGTPPWGLLSAFMNSLSKVDLSIWSSFTFSQAQLDVFHKQLPTVEDALKFYQNWKRISIKAAAYCIADIPPSHPIALKLAEEWLTMVEKATDGDERSLNAYLDVDRNRNLWQESERFLMEQAEPYLTEIIAVYKNETE